MEISVPSKLVAGIAVAGAAAVVLSPVVRPESLPSLQRVSAEIQLAAVPWANPITELGNTLGLLGGDLFATNVVELFALPSGGGDISVFTNLGVIPQLLNGFIAGQYYLTGLPLLQAVGTNLSGYAEYGVQALQSLTSAVGGVTFGVPLTAFQVINGLITGSPVNIAEAIQTNIITPVTDAVSNIVGLTSTVLSNVVNNVTTVVQALPGVLLGVAQTIISGFTVVGTQLVDVVTETLGNITNPQEAWNALVDGLVSPSGVLGSLVSLSVGTGVLTPSGPVPSLRQTLTAATVGGALQLTNAPVAPAATVRKAAKAARTAAALSAPAVPAVQVSAATSRDADSNGVRGAASGKSSASVSGKLRVSRAAAAE
ncbi:MAG: hypothetical protein ACR2JI_00820 [Mycobacterium sp.]